MNILVKFLLALVLLYCTGCATIISGSRQTVEIMSIPSSAKVFINGVDWGNTPMERSLLRSNEYHLKFQLDGYKTYETKLVRAFNAWYIGNVIFGGIIGLLIDPATGAIYKLKPEKINGEPKKGTEHRSGGERLFITINMDIDSNLEKVGQLEKDE